MFKPLNKYEEEKKMRNVFEIIGMVLCIAIVVISDVITMIMHKSSGNDETEDMKLFERLSCNSAAGVSIMTIFILISQLF